MWVYCFIGLHLSSCTLSLVVALLSRLFRFHVPLFPISDVVIKPYQVLESPCSVFRFYLSMFPVNNSPSYNSPMDHQCI